jgi:ABC-type transport system involved in multi-copper enzyme maturation permease subunit
VIPAISSLISRSQNNGDDETALTLVSPIKRDDLIIGKLLAFLSLFLITIFLTFVFPYTVYYYLVVDSISWSVLTTFLLGSLIFAIPIFLLFYAVLFLLDSIST